MDANDYIVASVLGVAVVIAIKKYRQRHQSKPDVFTPEKIEEICKKVMAGEL